MDQQASSAQTAERSKAIDVIQTSTAEKTVGDTQSLTEDHMAKMKQEGDAQQVGAVIMESRTVGNR